MLKRIFICFFFFFSVLTVISQTSRFQAVTTRDGLPSNYVFGVSEDEDGYLWIGSDKGLGRFDGFRWQNYDTDNGLPGNYIPLIACNQNGGIWLSFPGKGIYYFDKKTGKCTFSTHARSLNGFQVNEKGDLFFCDIFSGETAVRGLQVKQSDPGKVITIFRFTPDVANTSISVDFSKKMVTVFGDTLQTPGNLELNELGWKTERKSFLPTGHSILRQAGEGLFYDNRKIYSSQGMKNDAVFEFPFDGYYLQVLQENDGLWLWNMKDGLFWLASGKPIRQYSEKDGLASLIVNDVYRSRRGDLLVSTLGSGLLKMLRPGNARIDTDRKIVKGFALHNNTVYAALEDRVLKFDILKTQDIETFRPDDKSLQGINIINDRLFINSLFGFSEYSIQQKVPEKIAFTKIGAGVSSVVKYKNGHAIGTYGSLIHIMDEKRNLSVLEESHRVSEKLIPASHGFFSLNSEDGIQHITDSLEPKTISTKNGLVTNNVHHVHEYKDTLWISTTHGITAVNKGKVVLNFPLGESLQGSHCVYSFHDTTGKFWVVTNRFLHEFDGSRFFKLSVFTLTEGKDDQIYSALFHPSSNRLVTGSGNRISVVNLALTVNAREVVPPKLAGIKIDDSTTDLLESVSVRADFKKISLAFHPGLTSPFFNTGIYYKLEGLHEEFLLLTDSLTVSFTGLRSGKYKLLAKTINSNGRESKVVELAKFKVLSPFWQRGWFIVLTTLLLSGLAFYLYENYKKNRRLRKMKLKLMEERVSLERIRISKDLHDHLGTSLVTMIAQTENIENNLKLNKVDEALDKVKQLSDQSRDTIDVLRETIWAVQENSHTVTEFLLRTRNFLHRVYLPKNIIWEVSLTGSGQSILSANQTLQLFRVIQESTQNIIKHACASYTRYFFFENENELRLEITDDGKGMHLDSEAGNGLDNIQHRIRQIGGTVNFHSNKGTTIFISIPLGQQNLHT